MPKIYFFNISIEYTINSMHCSVTTVNTLLTEKQLRAMRQLQ